MCKSSSHGVALARTLRSTGRIAIRLALPVVLAGLLGAQMALAQGDPAAICGELLQEASRNVQVSTSSSDYLNTVFSKYCNASGTFRQSGASVGLSAIVHYLPVKLTLGSSDASTAMTNFCRTYSGENSASAQSFDYSSTVVAHALDTVVQCMRIAMTGNYITHRILSDRSAAIHLTVATGNSMTLQDLRSSGNVRCEARDATGRELDLAQKPHYVFSGRLEINCDRSATVPTNQQGATVFNEGTVRVSTNDGPYDFTWPRAVQEPANEAARIQQELDLLRRNITATNAAITQDLGRVAIECETVHGARQADCPGGWVVTGCAAGKNEASVDIGYGPAGNGCWNQNNNYDWITARCCHAVLRPAP